MIEIKSDSITENLLTEIPTQLKSPNIIFRGKHYICSDWKIPVLSNNKLFSELSIERQKTTKDSILEFIRDNHLLTYEISEAIESESGYRYYVRGVQLETDVNITSDKKFVIIVNSEERKQQLYDQALGIYQNSKICQDDCYNYISQIYYNYNIISVIPKVILPQTPDDYIIVVNSIDQKSNILDFSSRLWYELHQMYDGFVSDLFQLYSRPDVILIEPDLKSGDFKHLNITPNSIKL